MQELPDTFHLFYKAAKNTGFVSLTNYVLIILPIQRITESFLPAAAPEPPRAAIYISLEDDQGSIEDKQWLFIILQDCMEVIGIS